MGLFDAAERRNYQCQPEGRQTETKGGVAGVRVLMIRASPRGHTWRQRAIVVVVAFAAVPTGLTVR